MRDRNFILLAGLACLVLAAPSSLAQFTENFETITASAPGTPMAGQNGWYVPAVANSNDMNGYTLAGNAPGFPANPAGGGLQFMGGTNAGGVFNVRANHPVTFTTTGVWNATVDICVKYLGTTFPATDNIASFSLQPSTTARYFIALARYNTPIPTTSAPTSWIADFAYSTSTNALNYASSGTASPGTGGTLPPCFRGLAMNTWYRWSITWDWALNQVLEVSIQNLSTGAKSFYRPTIAYLYGGPNNSFNAITPTDIRCFVGGTTAGNTAAFDNISVGPAATPPTSAEYQVNGPGGAMNINGVLGTSLCAANVNVALSGTATANFTDTGVLMEVGINSSALVPANGGGITLPAGIINLDITNPLTFLWGGPVPQLTAFPPFSGVFTVPGVPSRISAQMFAITPLNPAGYTLSQGNQINVQ